jgi:hypothetical protein
MEDQLIKSSCMIYHVSSEQKPSVSENFSISIIMESSSSPFPDVGDKVSKMLDFCSDLTRLIA